jgi:hypothetical protein
MITMSPIGSVSRARKPRRADDVSLIRSTRLCGMRSHLTVEQQRLALRLKAKGLSLRQIGPQAG